VVIWILSDSTLLKLPVESSLVIFSFGEEQQWWYGHLTQFARCLGHLDMPLFILSHTETVFKEAQTEGAMKVGVNVARCLPINRYMIQSSVQLIMIMCWLHFLLNC